MQDKVMTDDVTPPVYGGIDVCKERLDVHLHPLGVRFTVANDASGRRALIRRLSGIGVRLVVMEPTSKYHRAAHRHLHAAGIATALVNPLRARRFAEACGQSAKTDAIDASMLALMAQRMPLAPSTPPTAEQEALHELASARSRGLAERVALDNRLSVTGDAFLRRELKARLRTLAGHLDRLDREIAARIAADPALARRAAILRSIPGVGPVAATAFITSLRELGTLNPKQAAALAGLAPFARESGRSSQKRSIAHGRGDLRCALYMAALVASRRNPPLTAFYQRLRNAGKPAKLAIIAVARKLVVLANSLVAQNRIWNPQPA